MRNTAALMRYCARVWKYLPCRFRQKRQIVRKIRARGSAWLEQNPNRPFAEFEKAFGSPQAIAASHLEQMDAPEVLSKLDVRRKIVLAVVIAAAAALLMWAGAVTWALIDYYDGQNGKMIVYEPVVEERRHISEGTLGTDENGEVQIPE